MLSARQWPAQSQAGHREGLSALPDEWKRPGGMCEFRDHSILDRR